MWRPFCMYHVFITPEILFHITPSQAVVSVAGASRRLVVSSCESHRRGTRLPNVGARSRASGEGCHGCKCTGYKCAGVTPAMSSGTKCKSLAGVPLGTRGRLAIKAWGETPTFTFA